MRSTRCGDERRQRVVHVLSESLGKARRWSGRRWARRAGRCGHALCVVQHDRPRDDARRTVQRCARRGFPTWRPAGQRAGARVDSVVDLAPGAVDLDVPVTRVAPGERSTFEWNRLDHLMTTRVSVGGVVSLLGFATANVTALRTHAQVERTAAFFAVLSARVGDLLRAVSTFGVGAGKEHHVYGLCLRV